VPDVGKPVGEGWSKTPVAPCDRGNRGNGSGVADGDRNGWWRVGAQQEHGDGNRASAFRDASGR